MLARSNNQESQATTSPQSALERLRDGNRRFRERAPLERNCADDIAVTASGQFPFAIVLGCIDSRVPVELVFDQGVGDIFTARIAGNVVNEDVLGSMEFACKLAGSKAILVLGHTDCGAIKGAIRNTRLGNLTTLVKKIEPVVDEVAASMDTEDPTFVDTVAEANVIRTIDTIRQQSPALAEMENTEKIVIVGAMYDVSSGQVRIL